MCAVIVLVCGAVAVAVPACWFVGVEAALLKRLAKDVVGGEDLQGRQAGQYLVAGQRGWVVRVL